jgi:hypothetical protein
MKRISVILGLVMALAFVSVGAKPLPDPMYLIYDNFSACGADCNYEDKCIGADEAWNFQATGNLGRGETYTYISSQPMCHAVSKITVLGFVQRGRADLLVTLSVWDTQYSWSNEGTQSVCMVIPSGDNHGMKYWQVTITNLGKKEAKNVWLYGLANGTPFSDNACP